MATKEEGREVRFRFAHEDLAGDEDGKVGCDICGGRFDYPEVEIMFRGYTVCPACVLSGPQAVAGAMERNGRDEEHFKRIGRLEEDPVDRRDVMRDYLRASRDLGRVKSFMDIPGGVVAIAIAKVTVPGRPRRRKAA